MSENTVAAINPQVVRRWHRNPRRQGKLYLASAMDMASRRVLGRALGEHHDAALAYSALVMAAAVRGGQVPGVIMDTDSEYAAGLVRQACARLGIAQPMGRAPVRARQGGHRVLALHLGVRAPRGGAVRIRGSDPGRVLPAVFGPVGKRVLAQQFETPSRPSEPATVAREQRSPLERTGFTGPLEDSVAPDSRADRHQMTPDENVTHSR